MELNSNQITEILPHRYPFAAGGPDHRLRAGPVGQGHQVRHRATSPSSCGHFPAVPCDARRAHHRGPGPGGGGGHPVSAGEQGKAGPVRRHQKRPLQAAGASPATCWSCDCELTQRRGPVGFGKAVATVDGKVACQGGADLCHRCS